MAADREKAWIHAGWEDTKQKWFEWLEEMKKEGRGRKMERMHQHKVAQMIKSAQGSAGLLHKISQPTAWRRGTQILVNEEEDARLLDRCEAKRKEWAKHWQCDEEAKNVEGKPCQNEELKSLEEALPRLTESHLEEVSRLHTATTGEECDCFHPRALLDLTNETSSEVVVLLENVEQSRKWPQHACTTIIFLILKNVTNERPIALCRL